MKIYVITTGSYSDYGIHSIWSTKEKAEEVNKLVEDTNDVDEWDVDQFADLNPLRRQYSFGFSENSLVVMEREERVDPLGKRKTEVTFCNHEWAWAREVHILVKVTTDDKEKAFKIATDERARYLTEKAGL